MSEEDCSSCSEQLEDDNEFVDSEAGCDGHADDGDSFDAAAGCDGHADDRDSEDSELGCDGCSTTVDGRQWQQKQVYQSQHPNIESVGGPGWTVTRDKDDRSMCHLLEVSTGETFLVSETRARKAVRLLAHDDLLAALRTTTCVCNRKCYTTCDVQHIRKLRASVLVQDTELKATTYLGSVVRASNGKLLVNGRQVCRKFWSSAYGVSAHKAQQGIQLGKRREGAVVAPRVKIGVHNGAKYDNAHGFWSIFFEENCQRPNDDIRLWPCEQTYNDVYKEFYLPYTQSQETPAHSIAGFSTWRSARNHPDFADVKNRRKHFHARCGTCGDLKAMMLRSFGSKLDMARYQTQRRMHNDSVRAWRSLERSLIAQAQRGDIIHFTYDDTSALGFPHFGHRAPKNATETKFFVTPWLIKDHAHRRQDYVYMSKGRHPKGSNRLITELHAAIMRAKSSYHHPSAAWKSRKLVLVADNYSENKNNTLYAYCVDLVNHGFFDEVELLFGEVGHTHNGVDACHCTHNECVGTYFAADLGQWIANYTKAFHDSDTRPDASILDVVYDWTSYYKPVIRPLSGFTKTKADNLIVRGWRFFRNVQGETECRWKTDPALDPAWLGVDGTAGGAGLFLFTRPPEGAPATCEPANPPLIKPRYLNQLLSTDMRKWMSARGGPMAEACLEHNHESARTGVVVVRPYCEPEDAQTRPEWGFPAVLGHTKATAVVRVIRSLWSSPNDIWRLPMGEHNEHVVATSNEWHFSNDTNLRARQPLPLVRYHNVLADRCPVYHNPVNVAHRQAERDQAPPSSPPAVPANAGGEAADGVRARPAAAQREGAAPADAGGVAAADREESPLAGHEVGVPVDDGHKYPPNGRWRTDPNDNNVPEWFEIHFTPKVGEWCIGKAMFDKGEGGVFLGKITAFDTAEETVTYKRYDCKVSPWTEACLDAKWCPRQAKRKAVGDGGTTETDHNYNMLAYWPKLTTKNKFPKALRTLLQSHEISWEVSDLA